MTTRALLSLPDAIEIGRQLDKQGKALYVVLDTMRRLFEEWQATLVEVLADSPELIYDVDWWQDLAASDLAPDLQAAFLTAIEEAVAASDFAVSWTRANPRVQELARVMAFDLVNLDNPRGIVRPRMGFLEDIRGQLATGELAWSDLSEALEGMFSEYRARLIARTEVTTLWANSHMMAATESGMGFKRSIRAELGRRCPTNVCNEAQAEGWIPIDQEFAQAEQLGPAYHPHCYCYLQFSGEGG